MDSARGHVKTRIGDILLRRSKVKDFRAEPPARSH